MIPSFAFNREIRRAIGPGRFTAENSQNQTGPAAQDKEFLTLSARLAPRVISSPDCATLDIVQWMERADPMSEADEAYRAAQAEIARVAEAGDEVLYLSGGVFGALERLPKELADLTNLVKLTLSGTRVSD